MEIIRTVEIMAHFQFIFDAPTAGFMRIFFILFWLGLTFVSAGQDYVSSGIIAYHAGAYERCVEDLTKSLRNASSLGVTTRAKAHFYRGMARSKLMTTSPGSSALGTSPTMSILEDLTRARNLDSQWAEKANPELKQIISQIVLTVRADYERALQTKDPNVSRPLLSAASDKLLACMESVKSAMVVELMAQVCRAHGDVYYNMAEVGDPMEVQRQFLAHYSQAVEYYELFLTLREGNATLYGTLQLLSKRLGDAERESRYAYLASQIGE